MAKTTTPKTQLDEGKRMEMGTVPPALATIARTLRPAELTRTDAVPFYTAVNLHTERISYPYFAQFVERVLCGTYDGRDLPESDLRSRINRIHDQAKSTAKPAHRLSSMDTYQLLRTAAEAFLLLNAGSWALDENGRYTLSLPSEASLTRDEGTHDSEHTSVDPSTSSLEVDVRVDALGSSVTVDNRAVSYSELQSLMTRYMGTASGYLDSILESLYPEGGTVDMSPFCAAFVDPSGPYLMELIWSYWMEEAMLTQTVNAITLRFQNVRRRGRDPLADFELDPLRPLSGFLWGYLQDETHRLSLVRRAYEYNHQYGLTLYGKAVPALRPADPRSRFLQAFHNLLRTAAQFYREDNDATVTAEAFGVLNALKEVHLLLAEGAHNQFRDLAWTARAEMLVQQWLLGRSEMREFLRGRTMIAYPEGWMGRVDAMKKLQGWNDTSVMHFRDLAVFGERLLLSIRYGNWSAISDQEHARTWARYWKAEVQGYVHAYQTVTGVNLADEVVGVRGADLRYLQPSYHLQQRMRSRNGQNALR